MLKTCQGLAGASSLVLIDELGRGTSPREGLGISHAIAESLIQAKVRPIHILTIHMLIFHWY